MAGAADWNLSDTIRDRIFKRLSLGESPVEEIRNLADWLHPQSDSYRADLIHGDEAATRFTGTPKFIIAACTLETDTDANGFVYGSLVDGAPNTINLYKEQGRSTLVATGTAADGATLTFAPETGYTLAGSVPLGTIGANEPFALKISPPFSLLLDAVFDGSEEEDGQNKDSHRAAAKTARGFLQQAAQAMAAGPATTMRTTFRRRLVSRTSEDVIIDPRLTRLNTGQVETSPIGLGEDTRLAMEANSGGSTVMKAGAPTQSTSTALATGTLLTFTTITLGTRGVPAIVTLNCVKSLDRAGDPEFDVVVDPLDTRRKPDDGKRSILVPNRLQIGKTWRSPEHGIAALLVDYTPTVSNTSGTSLSATAADWIRPAGLKSTLSDAGKLYTFYEASITRLEFYKTAAGRDAQDQNELVTYYTIAPSAVNTDFTTEDLGNGLRVKGKTGAGTGALLVDGDKGTVNFQPPISQSPSSRATITIDETVRASLQLRAWRDGYLGGAPGTPTQTAGGWEPHTGSAPNIPDSWLQARTLSNHARVSHRRG